MKISSLRFVALAALIVLAPCAQATVAEEAQILINQGRAADALKKVDAHLSKNPQDAEARFARGLALVKLNRNDDAIKAFADLTRDYPQLPEPYNNLAVLYAQQGDYEKARDALEAALATHPSYATAHENLGDIYAALAGAAYNRALMLDQNNQVVRNKLNLISQLDRVPAGTVAAVTTPAAPAAATPARPAAAAPVATPASATAAAATPTVPPVDTEAINNAVFAWTKAWSAQDVSAYLASYADDFKPEGLDRKAWEAQRKERIAKPAHIKVTAARPQVTVLDANRARVSFAQEYESDSFNDTVNKVLELKLEGNAWKITREYTR